MKRIYLLESRTVRVKRKAVELRNRVIRDTLYFIFTGLIFYGLVNTTIVPAIEGIYVSARTSVLTVTEVLIPMSNADVLTVDNPARIISPISLATTVSLPDLIKARKAVIPTPEPEMSQRIRRVFGRYTDKALYLLGCENSSLNPDAVNTAHNVPEGSKDIGLFQINNYWNDIGNVSLLKDPDVNIAVAWHKFKASGYSFNQWTCGRALGI